MEKQIENYESDWVEFRKQIEALAKGRCIITNKNWRKIRDIHMSQYLKDIENPFFFLFQVKFFHPEKYRDIKCIPKYYSMYREERNKSFSGFNQ